MNKYREQRFNEGYPEIIGKEVEDKVQGMDETARKDLVGLVSSLMILEDYKKEKKH